MHYELMSEVDQLGLLGIVWVVGQIEADVKRVWGRVFERLDEIKGVHA